MNENYYEDTQKIIARLKELQYEKWSNILIDDIRRGATGGEIDMAVRFHLKEMLQQEKALPVDVISMTRHLIQILSLVLKLPD